MMRKEPTQPGFRTGRGERWAISQEFRVGKGEAGLVNLEMKLISEFPVLLLHGIISPSQPFFYLIPEEIY